MRALALGRARLGIVFLAAVWLFIAAPAAAVLPDEPLPPDVAAGTYAGVRGILELRGDNVHNCGNLLLHITNFGLIGSQPTLNRSYSGAPSAQWPKGSATEYLFAAGLWVGADKNGDKHVTTGERVEFRPGRTELDRIYQTRELAPGGARLPASNADDDHDGRTDEDWLDGRDNDGDGQIDEDFAAISNQMFFCEYGDADPTIRLANPEHVPLELHVQQSSLCWETPVSDDFIAFDFRLVNTGFSPLEDVYVGFFADCDIGLRGQDNANDDYAGFWEGRRTVRVGTRLKNVKLSIGYMWDDDGDEGQSEGYIGLMFLGAQDPNREGPPRPVQLRNCRFFSGNAAYEQGGDPRNDAERYEILQGTAPRSLPPPGADGFRPGVEAKRRDDYRIVVSAGRNPSDPQDSTFASIAPGDTISFQAALVIGRGFEGMVENAIQAQLTYDGAYLDIDQDPSTGVGGRETRVCPGKHTGDVFCFDACDSLCNCALQPECRVTIQTRCEFVNADCELEQESGERTGIDGKEYLIHWLVGTAPPPPNMRVVAQEGRVDILWDNRSETTPDLRLSEIDFESYRIWRADNWTRPYGTDVNTGPGGQLWALLAEYDVPANQIGSDTGLEAIRYQPQIPEAAVQFYREWFRAHPLLPPPALPGFSSDQLDSAAALARGVTYYQFVDPPFLSSGRAGGSCVDGTCPPLQTPRGPVPMRCDAGGRCRETGPPPHSGAHYFYSVTATDHKLELGSGNQLVPAGPGLAGDPSSSFVYLNPPTTALTPAEAQETDEAIYVVPNPATPETMRPWTLSPTNADPTGIKVEFHHLPQAIGKVSIFTLAGDLVKELVFDGTNGNGSLPWDLVSRNGQDITSGVYLFAVEADDQRFERFVGKFVVVR